MSDYELLQKCIKDLGSINVPMAFLEQIGVPIFNVRQNLINLCDSIEAVIQKRAQEETVENPDVKEEPVEE